MENDSTFVAPEGVYSVTEEHKPFLLVAHNVNVPLAPYPTRVSSVVVRYPASKAPGGPPGFAQLLNARKDGSKLRDDGLSLSSSDTADDEGSPALDPSSPVSPSIEHHSLFVHAPAPPAKKRVVRPKHNIRTTSSTFITRIQSAEGSAKALNAKQGDTTFLFYNSGKSFLWVEVGSKSKVGQLYRKTRCPHPSY